MRPYKLIQVGDIYQRPDQHVFWVVVEKCDEEKLIGISASYQHPRLPSIVWKKNSDSLFSYWVDKVP